MTRVIIHILFEATRTAMLVGKIDAETARQGMYDLNLAWFAYV